MAPQAPTGHPAGRTGPRSTSTLIDCDGCPARPHACADCVVQVLLGAPVIDDELGAALVVLADFGLVPPMRDPRSRIRQVG